MQKILSARGLPLLIHALRLEHYTLQLFKNREVLIRMINLGIPLPLGYQKTNFLQPLQFTLNIPSVFFDQFCKTTHMRLEVWVLRVHDYNLAPNS